MPLDNASWMTGSSCSPHARILKNRIAYQVLETVYHMIPAGTRAGPAIDEPLNASPAIHEYQNWVHTRLRESGLAKALAGGPDFLPDITVELPPFWRYISRLTMPTNYRRLTAQVTRNLAWYLGDEVVPITAIHKLRKALVPSLLLTVLAFLSFIGGTGLGEQPWSVLVLSGFALFACVFAVVWGIGKDTTEQFKVNCAELYAYLLEEYADPGPETAHEIQSILQEMKRDTGMSNEDLVRRARQRARMPEILE